MNAEKDKTTNLPRFGLKTLFYVTAVLAGAFALFDARGIFWISVVLGYWWWQFRETNKSRSEPESAFLSIFKSPYCRLLGLFGVLVVMSVELPPRIPPLQYNYPSELRRLALALHNYEYRHGHLPPAYVADEYGKPMHSWRVLLLPYLEENAIYDKYNFDEPWNGPNNSKLVDKLENNPFKSPESKLPSGHASFKLVTGPETAFEKDQTLGFDAIPAMDHTICLVDDNLKTVNWMSPEDVTIDQAVELFDWKNTKALSSHVRENKFSKVTHRSCFVAYFDSTIVHLGQLKEPSKLRAQFTIAADPEPPFIKWADFLIPNHKKELKPEGYIALAINFVLALLPIVWFRRNANRSQPNDAL